MEINSLKNKLLIRLCEDVRLTIDSDHASVSGSIYVVHRVGSSLRFDRICQSVDDAFSVARQLASANPSFVYSIVVESSKLIHYADVEIVK